MCSVSEPLSGRSGMADRLMNAIIDCRPYVIPGANGPRSTRLARLPVCRQRETYAAVRVSDGRVVASGALFSR